MPTWLVGGVFWVFNLPNILGLRLISQCLSHWTQLLCSRPVRIQLDNDKGHCRGNHQGGTRSLAAALEVSLILRWVELQVPALSIIYLPGVENWQVGYLSHQLLERESGLCTQRCFISSTCGGACRMRICWPPASIGKCRGSWQE